MLRNLLFAVFCWLMPGFLTAGICAVKAEDASVADSIDLFMESYCVECHDDSNNSGGISLDGISGSNVASDFDLWERALRRLERRQMPPQDGQRPAESEYERVVSLLQSTLDHEVRQHPRPGRTDSLRRLTRTEYGNAVRDLLGLQLDVTKLLPADESSFGFDNITVGNLSPTLLNRYISAARKISRLAIGNGPSTPVSHLVRMRPDVTQEEHVDGLPLGTRGGVLVEYTFPEDGIYEIQVRLMRDRNEHVEGLKRPHQLEILFDDDDVATFELRPPKSNVEHALVDADLNARVSVKAGLHAVGVTFVKQSSSLLESVRQPYDAHFNFYRHPRLSPAVYEVSILGPYEAMDPSESPKPTDRSASGRVTRVDDESLAKIEIRRLLRLAYRRNITNEDLQQPMEFYRAAREKSGHEGGMQAALRAILVNPNFLFRVERDPADLPPQTPYRIEQFELASRLSFFLWSSLPDEELLDLAERGRLNQPGILEAQVERMLRDSRANSLVTNFASQWLYLRNLDGLTPDLRTFPDFDHNLREAFRRETELFFQSIVMEDRSVLDLLHADYTYLNERLAKHYDIPHVYGSRFRRVELGPDQPRGGLLRHGSILMVTSYATRTSPVKRGKWILENLLGTPPPPPPENVAALAENSVAANLSVRARLAAHRENEACASCHNLIDPIGLAMENFDAVGRWRDKEAGVPVDVSGGLPDGSSCQGVEGLEQGLLKRPEVFASTLTEKLMTFALGRGMEPSDWPAVRRIVRQAKEDDFRFSALIAGIVKSDPFQLRTTP